MEPTLPKMQFSVRNADFKAVTQPREINRQLKDPRFSNVGEAVIHNTAQFLQALKQWDAQGFQSFVLTIYNQGVQAGFNIPVVKMRLESDTDFDILGLWMTTSRNFSHFSELRAVILCHVTGRIDPKTECEVTSGITAYLHGKQPTSEASSIGTSSEAFLMEMDSGPSSPTPRR